MTGWCSDISHFTVEEHTTRNNSLYYVLRVQHGRKLDRVLQIDGAGGDAARVAPRIARFCQVPTRHER